MRGTGASSQGGRDGQAVEERREGESESTRLSPRLASVESIDLSVWLHAQGIARMEDVRGGEGGLRTVEEMEATFSRRAWSSKPVVGQNCRNRPEWLRLTQLRIWSMLEMSTGP